MLQLGRWQRTLLQLEGLPGLIPIQSYPLLLAGVWTENLLWTQSPCCLLLFQAIALQLRLPPHWSWGSCLVVLLLAKATTSDFAE